MVPRLHYRRQCILAARQRCDTCARKKQVQADPTNADAKQQLALIASELKKAKATQQKAFSSFFASSPSSEPADAEAQSQPGGEPCLLSAKAAGTRSRVRGNMCAEAVSCVVE
eukprot:852454-Rhodomonas_salina.1